MLGMLGTGLHLNILVHSNNSSVLSPPSPPHRLVPNNDENIEIESLETRDSTPQAPAIGTSIYLLKHIVIY